jgi:hypothetical protein
LYHKLHSHCKKVRIVLSRGQESSCIPSLFLTFALSGYISRTISSPSVDGPGVPDVCTVGIYVIRTHRQAVIGDTSGLLQSAMKNKAERKRSLFPWSKRIEEPSTMLRRSVLCVGGMVLDPITQCFTLLVLVISSCLIWKRVA